MREYSWKRLLQIGFLLVFFPFYFLQALTLQEQNQILERASFFSHTGVLSDNGEGFIYVKVDDNYIHKLFPLIQIAGFKKPPYFRRPDSPGAHISVFYTNETQLVGPIKEIGQTFTFTLKDVKTVRHGKYYYTILEVEAPELEKLREKYGLSPKLQSHEFHITLARKNADKKNK